MTGQITSTMARHAGAYEAVDQLHAAAAALRDAVYACTDATEMGTLARAWDYAELELRRAVDELLSLTIDGDQSDAPVAWTHRCAQIACIAGATEAQVDDVCIMSYWGMSHAEQIAEINRMHDAALADIVSDVLNHELA